MYILYIIYYIYLYYYPLSPWSPQILVKATTVKTINLFSPHTIYYSHTLYTPAITGFCGDRGDRVLKWLIPLTKTCHLLAVTPDFRGDNTGDKPNLFLILDTYSKTLLKPLARKGPPDDSVLRVRKF